MFAKNYISNFINIAEGKILANMGAASLTTLPFDIPALFGDYSLLIYIGAITAIVVVVVVIWILLRKRKKKKTRNNFEQYGDNASPEKRTEILTNSNITEGTKNPCVRLRNVGSADQTWDLALNQGILVGRDTSCQVCLDEKSVSRQQCRLYTKNSIPMIENLSESNITQLNGKKLKSPTQIKAGDHIKCGRITLIIDSFYESTSENVGSLNKGTVFINI
jgi:uncharacterized membrane protein